VVEGGWGSGREGGGECVGLGGWIEEVRLGEGDGMAWGVELGWGLMRDGGAGQGS